MLPRPLRAISIALFGTAAVALALHHARQRGERLRRAEVVHSIGANLPNAWITQIVIRPDGSHTYTYISANVTRLVGYTPDQIRAWPGLLPPIVHPDDQPALIEHARAARRALAPLEAEVRIRTAAGATRWFQLNARPQQLAGGAVCWNSVLLDITTWKKAEEALRSSERDYRALALEHSRLYDEARRQAEELETLRQAGAAVTATLDINEAIGRLLDQLALVVPYDSASVQLRSGDDSEVIGCRGFPDPSLIIGVRFPIRSNPLCQKVYTLGQTVILADTSGAEGFVQVPGAPIRSWLALPLMVGDYVIGMLALDSATPEHFTAVHARLGLAFATHVAIALKHAQSYRREVQARARLMALQQATREIAAHRSAPGELYAAVHTATRQLLPLDGFAIVLFNLNGDECHDVYLTYKGQLYEGTSYLREGSFADMVVRRGQPLVIDDFETFTEFPLDSFSPEDATRSGLAVALQGRSRTLGVLIASCDRVAAYGDEDVVILELLAAHVAIALENGALFAEVERLATTDALTGLANRRHFFAQARLAAARCHRRAQPLAFALLDLDHFKKVNDTYGHQTGDRVLQEVARICWECVRTDDLVGRYGGEELAILMPDTDVTGGARVAERIRAAIATLRISAGDTTIGVTASLGVSVAPPQGSVEAALASADQALYAAKAAGRDRVEVRAGDD